MSTDIVRELTPHTWTAAEYTAALVAVQCAIQGNFARMEEHLRSLPRAALVDLRYALDVMHPLVRLLTMTREKVLVERAERSLTPQEQESTSVDGNDRPAAEQVTIAGPWELDPPPLRCPRCGHDDAIHEDEDGARLCIDCGGFCSPVVTGAGPRGRLGDRREGGEVSGQSTWPAHLRDDAPSQKCNRCGRCTWDADQFGAEDRMTQPDGNPCGGRFDETRTDR